MKADFNQGKSHMMKRLNGWTLNYRFQASVLRSQDLTGLVRIFYIKHTKAKRLTVTGEQRQHITET